MAENWNNAVRLSTGRYVQVLHDDDFLAKGKLGDVVSNLRDDDLAGAVNLFGVRVVNQSEEVVRRQTFRRYRYLTPENALRSVLSDSAFVRFPGMVIRRDVFDTLGYFRPELGYPADTEMWARLVSRHGLACHPVTIANFTVHQNALTMKMFNAGVIETQDSIFQEIRSSCRMDDRHLEKVRSAFFNKFILGGACRYIRWRNLSQAKSTMRLFQEVTLRSLPVSWKWLPLRVILTALLLPLRASRPELHGVHAGE